MTALLIINMLAMVLLEEEGPSISCLIFIMISYGYLIGCAFGKKRNFGEIFTIITLIKIVIAALIFHYVWIQPQMELGILRTQSQIG